MAQRVLLITGCSSGIGYDAAHGLRERGWRVFASCRQAKDCDRLKAEGLDSPRIDHEDPQSVEEGFAEVMAATGGRLDGLFNNGAYAVPALTEDIPRAALEAVFSANVFGVHQLTRLAIPAMRETGGGRIVQNSSVLGFIGMKWRGAYVATKHALEGLTDCLRMELAGSGIEVCLIEPGPVTSSIRKNAARQFERWIDWEASARKDEYGALMHRLYVDGAKDKYELPASAVTAALVHALESRRPRPRYYVTTPTRFAGAAKRLLSTRALDRVLTRG